ncbi:MAG: Holliday junction resolvase RuvX [Acidimicrobiia bacterium]|jgi:putative holliday junction resolvase
MILGRVLALDPGERRIGVAISDPLRITAQPLMVIDRNLQAPLDVIREVIESRDVDEIVVGLPVPLRGGEGPAAMAARAFADEVRAATGLPVTLVDERFSTHTAEQAMLEGGARRATRRASRDKVAAAVILRSFLERTT